MATPEPRPGPTSQLCALSGTLLGDMEAVYDPNTHNDRLLLGLKGTISEAELFLIRQRMAGGRIAKARRGELAVPLPSGLVRRPSGEVVLDPDEQVRAVITLIFSLFDRIGTVGGVLAHLADNRIQAGIRLREGLDQGELAWRRPSRNMIQNMLRNPAYAGIYAYGRSSGDSRRRKPDRPYSGRKRVERGQWLVFLPGIYPAYISAEQYERNMRRMDANRSRAQGMGVVREGPALLAGLVRCGRCGRKMSVRYQRGPGGVLQPAYVCGMAAVTWAEERCQQLSGTCVDQYVSGLALQAMAPAALEVSLAAAEQEEQRRGETDRIWRQRLERADYAADRARRQYQLAEPENRLVVRQLEKDWNEALAERQRLGEDYDRHLAARPRALTAAERDEIRALAADLPAVWNAETTTDADRKQLLRHLIEAVTVTVIGDSEQVDVEVTWAGGHRTGGRVVRPVAALAQLSYLPRLRQRAGELLAAGSTAAQIAGALNAEGLRPPKRSAVFTVNSVRELLSALGLTQAGAPPAGLSSASTNGGSAISPSTWECPRSPWTPGSAAAGPTATSTPRRALSSSAPTPPRPNDSASCTRLPGDSTCAAPGSRIRKPAPAPIRKETQTMTTGRAYASSPASPLRLRTGTGSRR